MTDKDHKCDQCCPPSLTYSYYTQKPNGKWVRVVQGSPEFDDISELVRWTKENCEKKI